MGLQVMNLCDAYGFCSKKGSSTVLAALSDEVLSLRPGGGGERVVALERFDGEFGDERGAKLSLLESFKIIQGTKSIRITSFYRFL